MLATADAQRYARQILIPQVGRVGQELWLASRVEAVGAGRALETAVELVAAAGVSVDRRPGSELEVPRLAGLLIGETAFVDSRAACAACLAAFLARPTGRASNARPTGRGSNTRPTAREGDTLAASFATGAAAAAEVLLQLLDPARAPLAMAFVPELRRVAAVREGCACSE